MLLDKDNKAMLQVASRKPSVEAKLVKGQTSEKRESCKDLLLSSVAFHSWRER